MTKTLSVPELSASFHRNTFNEPGSIVGTPLSASEIGGAMPKQGFDTSVYPALALPLPDAEGFSSLLRRRRSRRSFSDADLDLATLSTLCFAAYGVVGSYRALDGSQILQRTSPSAGALYPLELYVYCNRVAGVDPGLFHYDSVGACLRRLRRAPMRAEFDYACCEQGHSRNAAATFVFAADFQRNQTKYGARGYRYVWLDVGHAAENLCLAATERDLCCFTSCGFFDAAMSALLRLDGVHQAPLYLAYVGLSQEP